MVPLGRRGKIALGVIVGAVLGGFVVAATHAALDSRDSCAGGESLDIILYCSVASPLSFLVAALFGGFAENFGILLPVAGNIVGALFGWWLAR